MRLIDIEDEVLWKNLSEGGRSAKQVVKLFMKQPTVEAIPIWWIEEWCKYLRKNINNISAENFKMYKELYEEYLKMERYVSMMIEYWRRENE